MSAPQSDYNLFPVYPACNTSIGGLGWERHLDDLLQLSDKASEMGLPDVALLFAICRAEHRSAELRLQLQNEAKGDV
jgi:hypothetical protein